MAVAGFLLVAVLAVTSVGCCTSSFLPDLVCIVVEDAIVVEDDDGGKLPSRGVVGGEREVRGLLVLLFLTVTLHRAPPAVPRVVMVGRGMLERCRSTLPGCSRVDLLRSSFEGGYAKR